ncbi:hypothetical protein MMP65_14090 [Acinetobacter sp. ANC 3926]|uniref:Uncharacterized protein n=1 Tax=Acinetobacter genomosp. 15BJ TaxID=106651 RepID=R9AJG5_9GAMM|nr:hypothetical protein [Acinetobacter genomosp. 15BJ]EOR02342.1 hypothetical protein F896_04029 [Acinetobacter genomosp. 15BJ]MCH7292579.1 hypothetical protein [Acinetobacter genomosp. 15BJ]
MNKTSSENKLHTHCDHCNKQHVKIVRYYQQETYCANCYRTWFTKKPCSSCGEIKRLHKKEHSSVCLDCRRHQPCIRCGCDAVKHSANTPQGRACQSCYQRHFKAPQQCFECGKKKTGLSRYQELPHQHPICGTCYQQHVCETCPACRRYRKLVDTPQGKLCHKCHELGEINCPSCQKLMPAGCGEHCWSCYWQQRLIREVEINQNKFASDGVKQGYGDFIKWFVAQRDYQVVTLKHQHFVKFFERCNALWGQIPNYDKLANEFKPEGLRSHLTVLRWLIDTGQITINLKVKDDIAEQERIQNLLGKFDAVPEQVDRYYEILVKKINAGRTTLKSLRLALQPVAGLYQQFGLIGAQAPSQAQIDNYLTLKSGQRNALYGFINYLNQTQELELKCEVPDLKRRKRAKRQQLEQEIMGLARQTTPLSKKDQLRWLQLGMAYFHDQEVSLKALANVPVFCQPDNEMLRLNYEGKHYWLPRAGQ